MHVRPAAPEDLGDLLALWRELEAVQDRFRLFPAVADAPARIEASFRDAISSPDADVLVAVDDDGSAAGMALVHVERPSRMSEEVAVELSRVVVRAGGRRGGVGRLIVDAAGEWARARGIGFLVAAVFVDNEPSARFWRAAGFRSWVERMVKAVDPG